MLASVVARGSRRKSLTLRGVDPETCMIVFKNHWAQVTKPDKSSVNLVSLCTNQTFNQPFVTVSHFRHNGWQTTSVCVCVCVCVTDTCLAFKHKIHLEQSSFMAAKNPPHPTHTCTCTLHNPLCTSVFCACVCVCVQCERLTQPRQITSFFSPPYNHIFVSQSDIK
ncbi:unnamed protein product [Tetraodon nigroviridis]|uniref:(spotted green pufferfish) hypothetical protein n=1 Tax=Tetraodon nigroviridis TaxID=99883 RepID=Q4SAY4_TETNG|nr:unnamed protein product [Tetraodon nigroviridis]